MTEQSSKSAAPVSAPVSTNPERVRGGLAYTDFSKSPIVRATWYALEPGVRALLNAFGAQHDDHEETSNVLAEVAAIELTHPYVKSSERLHVNTSNAWNADRGIFIFHFGAYGDTHVLAFGSLEDALEDAAETLKEVAPGCFTDPDYADALSDAIAEGTYPEGTTLESLYENDDYTVIESAETDLTYTESGHIASWEWTVSELDSLDEIVPFILAGL
jgi:hypothetical protein